MTLYALTQSMMELMELAKEGEIDSELLEGTLECLNDDYADKLEAYAIIIKELEADKEKFIKEMDRLNTETIRLSKNIAHMKDSVKASLIATGQKKVETEHFKWSIRKNGGKLPLICTDNLEAVPERFIAVKKSIDRNLIREALENGEKLDFAEYGQRGESLVLK